MNKLNIICIVLFSCWTFSVKAQDLKKQADKLFDDNEYSNAASLYLASLQQDEMHNAAGIEDIQTEKSVHDLG
jgi:hypothetical protein